ncbi:transcriptional regulator [Sorangium cellulosum]|uniref:Transcriptional regulator n=1 Tax=Sorangium cellulosum TaxID=56 RepID=A0A4P2Q6V7_SORCE|nr:response regulator [Sorangium cellulosum]AUX25237.1 transcriptional regulator [Sorangium cellulosum]
MSEEHGDADKGRRRRVVIIDDDDAIVETLEEVLEAEGYDVEGYTDPLEALEQLRSQAPPDVIVLDCVMPFMDGPRLMETLTAEGSTVPVVLVTALSDPGFCIDPNHPSATRVINKPFDLEQLLETLDDLASAPAVSDPGSMRRARAASTQQT